MISLATIWIGIIAFAVIMYVILDGFDLGIGILSPFFKENHRNLMISSIMPVWDGNETWLVLGGASLYGAFPLAFSTLLPTLYFPIMIMVISLLFRGVAFEFRLKSDTTKKVWDLSFFFGSLIAAFMQGILLGTFVQGFDVIPGQFVVKAYAWFTPFSITCGVALIFGYALLGATWLISKTTADLQTKSYATAKILMIIIAFFAVGISFWTPLIDPQIKSRWMNREIIGYLAILPFSSIVFWLFAWFALAGKREYSPFWLTISIFLTCYAGFIIGSWPYIVPHAIPFWEAAAPRSSLLFMLVGALIMLPILLYYTYHSYRIFRGKVTDALHY